MEVFVSPKKRKTHHKVQGRNVAINDPAYAKALSFYTIPPTEEVTIQEFESFALDRIRVLKEIESMHIRGVNGNEYHNRLADVVAKYLPPDDVRKDVISHFTLRLAYCRAADRTWLLNQEKELLRFRLKGKGAIKKFIEENNLEYSMLSREEQVALDEDLRALNNEPADYYKVPFEQALELVRHRKVILRQGIAFVHQQDFASILIAKFRHHLSEALTHAYKVHASIIDEHDTIGPILSNLSTMYLGTDYKPDTTKRYGKVEPSQLDMLSKRSFPMCMRNLHEKLRENHHLKHMGRLQYGLFLKGIGLSLEDALVFWRSEFARLMGVDHFEKNYAYSIRHNYGKEGKRADYTPYSCLKIIMGTVGAGEHHGCPFRHFDQENITNTLRSQGVSTSGIREMIDLVKDGHYQIACRKHFELTHPNSTADFVTINHPNQYFDQSEKYFNGEDYQSHQATIKNEPLLASLSNKNPTNSSVPATPLPGAPPSSDGTGADAEPLVPMVE